MFKALRQNNLNSKKMINVYQNVHKISGMKNKNNKYVSMTVPQYTIKHII